MDEKRTRLVKRREHLIAQIAAQRTALAHDIEPWRVPLTRVDQGLAALRFIRNHPAWIAGGGVAFSVLGPSRIGKWLRYGWITWQVIHKLRSTRQ